MNYIYLSIDQSIYTSRYLDIFLVRILRVPTETIPGSSTTLYTAYFSISQYIPRQNPIESRKLLQFHLQLGKITVSSTER